MKVKILFIVLLFSLSYAHAQIIDTAVLRQYINATVVPNSSRTITATQLNNIFNGLLEGMKRNKVDSISTSAAGDTLYSWQYGAKKTFKVAGTGGGGTTDTSHLRADINVLKTTSLAAKDSLIKYVTPSQLQNVSGGVVYQPGTAINISGSTINADTATTLLSKNNASGTYVPKSLKINNKPLTADVTLGKSDVGLPLVDNTPDLSKPISSAQQSALNAKMNFADTLALSNRINAKLNPADTLKLRQDINAKLNPSDTLKLRQDINSKLNPADTIKLRQDIITATAIANSKLNPTDTVNLRRDVDSLKARKTTIIGGGNAIFADTLLVDASPCELELVFYTPGKKVTSVTTDGDNGSGFLPNFKTIGDSTHIYYSVAPDSTIKFIFSGIITDSSRLNTMNYPAEIVSPYAYNYNPSFDTSPITGIDKFFKQPQYTL